MARRRVVRASKGFKSLPCRVCGTEEVVDYYAVECICSRCTQRLVNYIRRKDAEAGLTKRR